MARGRGASRAGDPVRGAVHHRGVPPPAARRRQAVPAAARAARRRDCGDAGRAAGSSTAACVVELTHLASLYHDDVMDEAVAAPRCRLGATPAGTTTWRSSPATGSSRSPPSSPPSSARRRCASRRRPSPGSSRDRSSRRSRRGRARTLLEHYLRVVRGKTGSLIATSARYGAMFAGAPAEVVAALTEYGEKIGVRLPALRRHPRRRQRLRRVRQDAGHRPPRGRPDAADAAGAAVDRTRPTRGCSSCSSGPLADDAPHAEALALLRAHPAMDEARAYVLELAREATERARRTPRRPGQGRARRLRRPHRHPHRLTPATIAVRVVLAPGSDRAGSNARVRGQAAEECLWRSTSRRRTLP